MFKTLKFTIFLIALQTLSFNNLLNAEEINEKSISLQSQLPSPEGEGLN